MRKRLALWLLRVPHFDKRSGGKGWWDPKTDLVWDIWWRERDGRSIAEHSITNAEYHAALSEDTSKT